MRILIIAVFALSLSGCSSLKTSVDRGITDWDARDLIGYTLDSKEENDHTEFRFYDQGYLVAILGVEGDPENSIAPMMKWKKEKGRLIIYDDISEPIIYTVLELTETDAVLKTGQFIHRFTKLKNRAEQVSSHNSGGCAPSA